MAAQGTAERDASPMASVPEAAFLLGVDEQTIHRLIRQEILPAGQIVRGQRSVWRIPRALITAFLAAIHAGGTVSLDDFARAWRGPEATP